MQAPSKIGAIYACERTITNSCGLNMDASYNRQPETSELKVRKQEVVLVAKTAWSLLHLLLVLQLLEQSVISYSSRFTRQATSSNLSKGVKMQNRVVGVERSKFMIT